MWWVNLWAEVREVTNLLRRSKTRRRFAEELFPEAYTVTWCHTTE